MDDDFTFGTSVWGTSDVVDIVPTSKPTSSPSEPEYGHQFDEFNDLGQVSHEVAADDEFGDFGDFGDFNDAEMVNSTGFEEEVRIAGPSSYTGWDSLKLDPLPSRSYLEEQVNEILGPIWGYEDLPSVMTDEGVREVEGISQVLVTPERWLFLLNTSSFAIYCVSSRVLYQTILQPPPPTKPSNWTRSRIRRQHLISLGIPVNLDEVLPRANGKPLPPLQITTRPMSAPPGPRNAFPSNSVPRSSTNNSRAGTPQPTSRQPTPPSHFGPKPDLDFTKIDKLLELDPGSVFITGIFMHVVDVTLIAGNLTISPLSTLERHLAELRAQTASTSTLLTYLLQTREALQQDNETYNGLIAELVGEAQKIKSGRPRANVSRKGTGMN